MSIFHKKIAVGVLVVIIFIIGLALFFLEADNQTPPAALPTPTPITVNIHKDTGARIIDKNFQKYTDNFLTPQPLSANDEQAKQRIVNIVHGQEGTVVNAPTFNIYYLPSLDAFDITLETVNTISAQQDVTNWFKSQGMSQEGICKIATTFSVDNSVRQQYPGKTFVLNDLPAGCQ